MRIPWTDRVTNDAVLLRAGEGRKLMKCIRRRQLKCLGHLLRGRGLEKDCLLGRVAGRRARGRQRKKFMDSLLEDIGGRYSVAEMVRMADERENWRSMIANVT